MPGWQKPPQPASPRPAPTRKTGPGHDVEDGQAERAAGHPAGVDQAEGQARVLVINLEG